MGNYKETLIENTNVNLNKESGRLPSDICKRKKGTKTEWFKARNEESAIIQGVKGRFKSAVEYYPNKEYFKVPVVKQGYNYNGLIEIGNLVQYKGEIKVALHLGKEGILVGNKNGIQNLVKSGKSKKPKRIKTTKINLNDIL